MDAKKIRPIFRQYALHGIARALAGQRKNEDAVKAFNDLLSKEPDTKFLREAHLGLIGALRAKPDLVGASAAVKHAADEAKSKALGDEFSVQVDLQKAGLLEDQKKWPEAHSEYSGLLKKADKFPNLAGIARLGMGRSIMNNKEIEKAKGYFLELSKSATTRFLLAGAYNGLGDCAYKAAETSKKADDYREALLMYSRAGVLGFPGHGELTTEHERSIFLAGCCNQTLAGLFKEDAAKQFFLHAAEQSFRELLSEYPRSEHVEAANKRLKDVQAGTTTSEPE
jgi:tetratricopeptide (TPR) repeat protein